MCVSIYLGDTLFVSSCGKFFEGTPEQMYHALFEVLALLPEETVRVWLHTIYEFINQLLF